MLILGKVAGVGVRYQHSVKDYLLLESWVCFTVQGLHCVGFP